MLQESYMLGTSGSQHVIESRIDDLVGVQRRKEFYDAWLSNHVRKIDIDSMASWGYNMVRLPMHYKLFTPPIEEELLSGKITWIDNGFQLTDSLLKWCKANNMYLILDLHAAPGGQGGSSDINDYEPSKPSLWQSDLNKQKTVALWKKLAEHYANEPNIAAYDLINEPHWGFQNHAADPDGFTETDNTPLWNLQKEITAAIREVDKNHIVIIEGNCYGSNYAGLSVLWDENLAVSYHQYYTGTKTSDIQNVLNIRNRLKVPIWLGETGENSNTWYADFIGTLEKNGIGWSMWPLKKLGLNNPLQITTNEGYKKILNYWNGGGAKPRADEAYVALMQLTEDLKLENNVYQKDVVDAMIRQPHTEETIPFKAFTIVANAENVLHANDSDLGKNGIAYSDKDFENTSYRPGGQVWNFGGSYRNDGVDIERTYDDNPNGNGFDVSWAEEGEWMQYTVNVDSSGVYNVVIRYAGHGKIRIDVDEKDASGIIDLPYPPVFQLWSDVMLKNFILNEGTKRIKVNVLSSGVKLNYFAFEKVSPLSTLSSISICTANFQVFPNPTNGFFTLSFPPDFESKNKELRIYNLANQVVFALNGNQISSSGQQLNISHLPVGIYMLELISGKYTWVQKLIRD